MDYENFSYRLGLEAHRFKLALWNIKKRIPQAMHVLDRFHVVQHLNKAVDQVRASEHKKLIKDSHNSVLIKSRWLLLRK